jgi:hypothetical protein
VGHFLCNTSSEAEPESALADIVTMLEQGICKCIQNSVEQYGSKSRWRNWAQMASITLLQLACSFGDVQLVEGLISRGADVNLKSLCKDVTPIYTAVTRAPKETRRPIMTCLIEAGCAVNVVAALPRGNTPLLELVCEVSWLRHGVEDVSDFIEDFKLLMNADPDFKTTLLTEGYFPNSYHASPLLLLSKALNARFPNAKNTEAVHQVFTLLHEHKHLEGFLENAGWCKDSPIEAAVSGGDMEMVKLLFRNVRPDQMKHKCLGQALMNAVNWGRLKSLKIYIL